MFRNPDRWVYPIALAATLLGSTAGATEFVGVDLAHSKIGFSYSEMGVKLDGTFSKFSVQLSFNPAKAPDAHALIDVSMSSVDAGSAEATSEVAGKDWFDTAHNPTAHFATTAVSILASGQYQLAGNLTIKGHTHAIVVPATLTSAAGQSALEGSFTFKRTDYGVGEGEWADTSIVADPIKVQFRLVLIAGS
jgi:polyisoprenoid-binding protein YceI